MMDASAGTINSKAVMGKRTQITHKLLFNFVDKSAGFSLCRFALTLKILTQHDWEQVLYYYYDGFNLLLNWLQLLHLQE